MARRHQSELHGSSVLITVWLAMVFWVAVFWFGSLIGQLIDGQLGLTSFAPWWLRAIGLVLTLSGVLLALTSAFTLVAYGHGSPNPLLVSAETLVTNGPYRSLRHPLYLGFVALAFGYGLVLDSIGFTLVIAPVLLVLVSLRSAFEEQTLVRQHGERYRAYRRRSVGLGWSGRAR